MYDARTEERFPHSPDYFCINQIPWDFPEGEFTGNETEKFLSSSTSAEDRKTIFQYLGLCMTRFKLSEVFDFERKSWNWKKRSYTYV